MRRQLADILRGKRSAALAILYAVIAAFSLYLAYEIRFDFVVPTEQQQERLKVLAIAVPIKLLALLAARQMGSMVTFFGVPDLIRLGTALLVSAGILLLPRFVNVVEVSIPRGVLLIDFLVCLAAFCGFRLSARLFRERVLVATPSKVLERVAIIGAGDTGASLVGDLINSPRGFRPEAFLDDDKRRHGKFIHGVPVEGAPEDFLNIPRLAGVRHAIIAMPSASVKRVREIALYLGRLGIQVEIVPALEDLASGRARVSRIRPVEIQDLLGRSEIELDAASIKHFVENKVVLVTGAGGSIGSELCRQISRLNPRRLLLVEQSEPALFAIEQELNAMGYSGIIVPLVADVLDQPRIGAIFATHSPQVVFHAAAHKHVYLMERQPAEAIKNNAFGTRKLAELAVHNRAEAFVLISTDKAVNPTNVMGASKRLAELHLQALHTRITQGIPVLSPALTGRASESMAVAGETLSPSVPASETKPATKLMAVRFGNVLGSSGSVVPIFKKQIEAGGPVTVTHPDVTRYFMTIPEAVGLVLQAGAIGQGGEIFVLDMGQPVKIVELAKNLIELSGFKVGEDIEIRFTGLKPGEKLYEELQHHNEQHLPTTHPRIMRFANGGNVVAASQMAIDEIEPFVEELPGNDLKRSLKVVIPEYDPFFE